MLHRSFTLILVTVAVILATLLHTADAASRSSVKNILKVTNSLRAKHHAPPLKWSNKLATYAQNWSNRCVFEHSQGQYGENLAYGYPNWGSVIRDWYSEVKDYNYDHPQFNAGHFTQLVWKETTEVGCGAKVCNNLCPGCKLYTCSYKVPGNMMGDNWRYFKQNVIRP
ncbi:hypothetical protein RMATCC62417_15758 [Rhizopus microsporus]